MRGCSIIICTQSRASLLQECLDSFTRQDIPYNQIEIIVVDNGSTDQTRDMVQTLCLGFESLRYVYESEIGLSHARNRGVAEARYDWVCFMDDDAKAHTNFNRILMQTIEANLFDGFGGMFYPWYRTPKPKWLSDQFGKMPLLRNDRGVLKQNDYAAGGICAFNKEKLLACGGFPPELGMRGNVVGYGEENYLQDKMREKGYVIGFEPEWKMDHLVAEYKYTLHWQWRRFVGKGRDKQLSKGVKLSILHKTYFLLRATAVALFYALKLFPKWVFDKSYYRQNYFLEVMTYPGLVWGRITC